MLRPRLTRATTPRLGAPATVPLSLLYVLHVEEGNGQAKDRLNNLRPNWTENRAAFTETSAAISAFAQRLRALGGKLSIMAPRQWWQAVEAYDAGWVQALCAAGHYAGLHARGGYPLGYAPAHRALSALVPGSPLIASGVLDSEVDGFPVGWAFTGVSQGAGHGASMVSLAGQHRCCIGYADTAADALAGRLAAKGAHLFLGYGSGSNSKPVAMARDLRAHGGVAVYDGADPEAVSGYRAGLWHGVMLDASPGYAGMGGVVGISAGDTADVILANAATCIEAGAVGVTFPELIAAPGEVPIDTRTAGHEAGASHWSGIGGGVQ